MGDHVNEFSRRSGMMHGEELKIGIQACCRSFEI
jgi:hypothetical protein